MISLFRELINVFSSLLVRWIRDIQNLKKVRSVKEKIVAMSGCKVDMGEMKDVSGGLVKGHKPQHDAVRSGDDETSVLQCSAFSRPSVRPKQRFMVTVAVHLPEEAKKAAERARGRDPKAEARDWVVIWMRVAVGTPIHLQFDVEGGKASDNDETFEWTGEIHLSRVTIQPDALASDVFLSVTLSVDGAPIGDISWIVTIDEADAEEQSVGRYYTFERPFISYSTHDRDRVAIAVASMEALRTKPFLDYISLQTGDEFSPIIEQKIADCDLFMVYWSANADASKWVHHEMGLAMARWSASDRTQRRPKLWPVTLEPDYPDPPADWKSSIHFENIITRAGFARRQRSALE